MGEGCANVCQIRIRQITANQFYKVNTTMQETQGNKFKAKEEGPKTSILHCTFMRLGVHKDKILYDTKGNLAHTQLIPAKYMVLIFVFCFCLTGFIVNKLEILKTDKFHGNLSLKSGLYHAHLQSQRYICAHNIL